MGGTSSKNNGINQHAKDYKNFIAKEIEIINPDIVILGGTYKFLKNTLGLKKYSYRVHKNDNGRIFINAYHPAYRKISKQKYYDEVVPSYFSFLQTSKN